MQPSLPLDPTGRNIKAVDLAEFVEIAKIVEVATQTGAQDAPLSIPAVFSGPFCSSELACADDRVKG